MKKWYVIYYYYHLIGGETAVQFPIHLFSEVEEDVLIQNVVNRLYDVRQQNKIPFQPFLVHVECLEIEGPSAGKRVPMLQPFQGSKIATALFSKWILTKDIVIVG